MGNRTTKITLASLIIAGSALSLFVTFFPWPPRLEAAPHLALGQAVAQETIKLLGAGGRVWLVARDTRTFPNPAADAQIQSFAKTLLGSGIRIGSTNLVKLDPLRVVGVPPGDFLQILKRASDADVVVSFLGAASLSEEQVTKLGDKAPKVIAVCTGNIPKQIDLKRLFDQKLLQAALISRPAPTTTGPLRHPVPENFEQLYVMVRAGELSELPMPDSDRR